jgi:hypothetical protein
VVRYRAAGGLDGVELGADVGAHPGPFALTAGYRTLDLESGRTRPHVGRAAARVRLFRLEDWEACGALHGGGSHFSDGEDRATVMAGGAGIRLVHLPARSGRNMVAPFVEVRGLAASATGKILGLDTAGQGLSIGGEAGLWVMWGRLSLQASGALDGLAPALGVTPYPASAARLAVGFRF